MKPLIFSEYRISYAREISEFQARKDNYNKTLEELMLRLYCHYLIICGYKNLGETIWSQFKNKVIRQHDYSPAYNEYYDYGFVEVINDEVDAIINKEFKK